MKDAEIERANTIGHTLVTPCFTMKLPIINGDTALPVPEIMLIMELNLPLCETGVWFAIYTPTLVAFSISPAVYIMVDTMKIHKFFAKNSIPNPTPKKTPEADTL